MSKEMKDFLSQFMNQPETKNVEPVEKKAAKAKTENILITQPKVLKVKNMAQTLHQAKSMTEGVDNSETEMGKTKPKAQNMKFTEGVEQMLTAEAFLQSINDKSFSFNKKKNLQIDDQLFNVLNLLKQHEDIKSIATLLNAIIEKYIDDNKVELKKILSKNPLI